MVAAFTMAAATTPTVAAQEPDVGVEAVQPSLTIIQVSTPSAPQDFEFTSCRQGGGCGDFALDDDDGTDATLPDIRAGTGLPPGTYTITQDPTTGWTLTGLTCTSSATVDLNARHATVTLEGNEAVTCTFSNASPSITIRHSATPPLGDDFTFTGCLGSGCADFELDLEASGQAEPTLPSSIRTTGLAPGTYTVTQNERPGWALDSLTCSGDAVEDLDQRRATIAVGPTDHVSCTFTSVTPSLRVVLNAVPDSSQDFAFEGCLIDAGGGCGPFALDDDVDPTLPRERTAVGVTPGEYQVTLDPVPGWTIRSASCNRPHGVQGQARVLIHITARTQATCTFTVAQATLTIVQDAEANGPQDFQFTGCLGSGCAPFALDDDDDPTLPRSITATGLLPGTYTVTQTAHPDWPLIQLRCDTGETVDLVNGRATIDLQAGENTTCTFRNASPRTITIVQDSAPDSAQDLTFTSCHIGTGCADVTLDDDDDPTLDNSRTATGLPAGSYLITQAEAPGLTSPRIGCDATAGIFGRSALVTLPADGAHVTCTFTNEPAGTALDDGIAVATGSITCALVAGSRARCWGPLATFVTDAGGDPVTDVAAIADRGQCYVTTGAEARCWGTNSRGRLGDGTNDASVTPVVVANPAGTGPLTGVAQLSGSTSHTCAALADGQARCWGNNSRGQLGDGTTIDRHRPVVVSNPEGTGPLTDVTQISALGSRTCAVLGDGQVRCWGNGLLGDGTTHVNQSRPVVVSNPDGTGPLTGVAQVSVGGAICTRLTIGEAYCWGSGAVLGDGSGLQQTRPVPVSNPDGTGPLTDVAQINVGNTHACARLTNGEARCWGSNTKGQLGTGVQGASVNRPVTVLAPSGAAPFTDVVSIDAGNDFTCAVQADGATWCWGQNLFNTLGNGSTHYVFLPTSVLTAP